MGPIMKKFLVILTSAVIGAGLVFLFSVEPAPAYAQQAAAEAPIFEIVVTAQKMRVQETQRPMGDARVSMNYIVGYADLDLTRPEDRVELEERVRVAAEEICELLAERYPGSQTSAASCTRQALRDALARVAEAIAAAAVR